MDDERAYTESVESLVYQAAAKGRRISKAQLHRWQQAGLLPKPRQRGQGRGRGSTVLYPAGTWKQLEALLVCLREDRSLRLALWRLWWDSHEIAEKHIRELLGEQLHRMHQLRRSALEGSFAKHSKVVGRARKLRRIVPVPKGQFPALLSLIGDLGTGRFEGLRSTEDADVARQAMGMGNEDTLRTISRTLNPVWLRESLDAASLADLHDARDELRALTDFKHELRSIVSSLLGETILTPLIYDITDFTKTDFHIQLHTFLIWVAIGTSDYFSKIYSEFLDASRTLRAGKGLKP